MATQNASIYQLKNTTENDSVHESKKYKLPMKNSKCTENTWE